MPLLPIFRLRPTEKKEPLRLASYTPALSLEGLQLGVDNLRHDVHLSPKFVKQARLHLARLIALHGNVEAVLAVEAGERPLANRFISSTPAPRMPAKVEPAGLKPLLTEVHVAALKRAKAVGSLSLDMLARAAFIKFLRVELNDQFAQLLERCRVSLKNYDGLRHEKALEYRERAAAFQVAKKIILRKTGQELFRTLREIEKETLISLRRSLFGDGSDAEYKLFLNPLLFNEDYRDSYLNAEHYVMLGSFERDPDCFSNVRRITGEFLRSLITDSGTTDDDHRLDGWLSAAENAQTAVGGGSPDESTPEGLAQRQRLEAWAERLEDENVMPHVVASYEVISLLAEYSPRIHAQQLKHALISREECERVEKLIGEHGRLSAHSLHAAVERVANLRKTDRAKMAGRFLWDFLRYHCDLRRLEALSAVLDSVNLIGNERMRELSAMNSTLYEFLLPEEQKPVEDKILRHVVIKADIRDSSRLTRSLLEKDLNPASYFSLNFYDPVNKLLPKYGASKVFLEGDAIILALLEREGEAGLSVGRACVLAREMIEIVQGYNQLLERAGLPTLELGVGISYQDSAPMYLMDGDTRIMISDALNESDRLSSCNKRVRKPMQKLDSLFRVYAFQTASDAEADENPDEFVLNYNLNGIRMSAAAFRRLEQEISLEPCPGHVTDPWNKEEVRLYSGLVPLGNEIFRKVVVRGSRISRVDLRQFSGEELTEKWYYEVCSNPAIYALVDGKTAAGR